MRDHITKKLDDDELVSFKEMMTTNSIKEYALAQLLIEKTLIPDDEFHSKLREFMMEYESKEIGKVELSSDSSGIREEKKRKEEDKQLE